MSPADGLSVLMFFHNAADPDDPLKTTDQTRRLGLIVRSLSLFSLVSLSFFYMESNSITIK